MNWLLIINLVAAACLFVHACCVVNRMSPRTNHVFRCTYIVLGTGALGVLLGPFYGYGDPRLSEVLVNVGAAGALIIGRWLRHGGWRNDGYSSLSGDLRYRDGSHLS